MSLLEKFARRWVEDPYENLLALPALFLSLRPVGIASQPTYGEITSPICRTGRPAIIRQIGKYSSLVSLHGLSFATSILAQVPQDNHVFIVLEENAGFSQLRRLERQQVASAPQIISVTPGSGLLGTRATIKGVQGK